MMIFNLECDGTIEDSAFIFVYSYEKNFRML